MSLAIRPTNNDPLTIEVVQRTREEVARYICLWGSSSSLTLLDATCKIFSIQNIEGVIGYREHSKIAVVYGDPVCAEEHKATLAKAFHDYCDRQNIRILYLTVSETFADWAVKNVCTTKMEVGIELIADPNLDIKKGSIGRTVRRKTSCAAREGVSIHQYSFHDDPKIKHGIEKAGEDWLRARKGPQIFFAHVDLINFEEGKRYFYAMKEDKVVGVIVLNKLEAYKGWVLHLLIITPDAPSGTSELLVVEMLSALQKENCSYVSFGVSQAEEIKDIIGLGKTTSWLARTLFTVAQKVFSLDGRRRFWEKFQPRGEKSFLLISTSRIGLKGIIGLIYALNVSS